MGGSFRDDTGIIGYILGLYRDNGKENGNYCNGLYMEYMGGCQNYGPFLGTLNIRCRSIIGIQKGAIIFTTTHMSYSLNSLKGVACIWDCYRDYKGRYRDPKP